MTNYALEIVKTLVYIQKQISTNDGRWFSIRILPYRTFKDRIVGLVITFINITESMDLEAKLPETDRAYHLLMNSKVKSWLIKIAKLISCKGNIRAVHYTLYLLPGSFRSRVRLLQACYLYIPHLKLRDRNLR